MRNNIFQEFIVRDSGSGGGAHSPRFMLCVSVCWYLSFFHLLLHLRHRIRLFCLVVACNIIRNTNNGNNNNPKLLMYSTKILYDKICTYINRFVVRINLEFQHFK